MFSIAQASKILNVSEITIRRLVRAKRIQHRRIGRRILFTKEDLDSFLENSKVSAVYEKEVSNA